MSSSGFKLLQGASGAQVDEFLVSNSLRLNDDDARYLGRTPTTAGIRTKWTFSAWVKRGVTGTQQKLLNTRKATNVNPEDLSIIEFTSADTIRYASFGSDTDIETAAVFRDPFAWYHIVVTYDSTQGLQASRVRIWVNGVRMDQLATYVPPVSNELSAVNNTELHTIGGVSGTQSFDGYMSQVYLIDGFEKTPDDFAKTDPITGQWVPKEYTGSYGTNGFYLNFSNASNLGEDFSGNGNSYTSYVVNNDMEGSIPTFSTQSWFSQSTNRAFSGSNSMRVAITTPTGSATSALPAVVYPTTAGMVFSFYVNIGTNSIDDYRFQIRNSSNTLQQIGVNFRRENDGSLHYYMSDGLFGTTFSLLDSNIALSTNTWYKIEYTTSASTLFFKLYNSTGGVLFSDSHIITGSTIFDEIYAQDADGVAVYYIDDLIIGNDLNSNQTIDTPTNNFSVLNSILSRSTLSQGNLASTASATTTHQTSTSSIAMTSGKYYFETFVGDGQNGFVGITDIPNYFDTSSSRYLGIGSNSWGYFHTGHKFNGGTSTTYGDTFDTGDIIGCALDMDAGTITFYKNNVSQGVAFTGLTGEMFFGVSVYDSTYFTNFGQDSSFGGNTTSQGNTDENGVGDFYYTPPTGYLALCTDNLPEPTIVDSESNFNVVTYTGDGTTSNPITVGFQPDFVWIKRRDTAQSHVLSDSVRGAGLVLVTDASIAEVSEPTQFVSFDSSGFTVGTTGGTLTNASGSPYVAWCWKAGGTAVTNNDGSITSQVSANVDAGFSIVSYTAVGSSSATVGHGLSSTPEVVIYKERNASANWAVMTTAIDGSYDLLILNSTSAKADDARTSPTSSLIYDLGYLNGRTLIAYCFHSVEGFSKIGTYTGNGSAEGPHVYTGFRPAFVFYKRTSSTGNWIISDNEREGYNWDNPALYPNLSNAESIGSSIDILSNGFRINNSIAGSDHNASGSTYIYMAFAEHPFNYATGR